MKRLVLSEVLDGGEAMSAKEVVSELKAYIKAGKPFALGFDRNKAVLKRTGQVVSLLEDYLHEDSHVTFDSSMDNEIPAYVFQWAKLLDDKVFASWKGQKRLFSKIWRFDGVRGGTLLIVETRVGMYALFNRKRIAASLKERLVTLAHCGD